MFLTNPNTTNKKKLILCPTPNVYILKQVLLHHQSAILSSNKKCKPCTWPLYATLCLYRYEKICAHPVGVAMYCQARGLHIEAGYITLAFWGPQHNEESWLHNPCLFPPSFPGWGSINMGAIGGKVKVVGQGNSLTNVPPSLHCLHQQLRIHCPVPHLTPPLAQAC